jgi:hypothetical protein
MLKKPPADRNQDNSLPRPPGSGPKPKSDDRIVRSERLRPRGVEPGNPGAGPEDVEDAAKHRLEQLAEYHKRLKDTGGGG